MIIAVLLLVLSQASDPGLCRFDRTGNRFRNCTNTAAPPLFQFAGTTGTGMTAECGCTTNPTGSNGETMVFARASDAWCEKLDFSWNKCATDKARVYYGDFQSSTLGLQVERAGTNNVLRNRDFSDAAWTKTTMTCNKDATGIDGVANSASTCTATAAAAIVSQAAACPASGANASIFLKRITGTGTVSVSCDGAAYYTVVPDSTWKRVSGAKCSPTSRCITVSGLLSGCNSGGVYLKLASDTDSVAVDFAQCEALGIASSPIETAGTAATRVKEIPYFNVAFGTTPAAVSVFSTNFTPIVAPSGQTSAATLYVSGSSYLWPFRTAATSMSCQLVGGSTTTTSRSGISSTVETRTGCKSTTVLNTVCTAGVCTNSAAITATMPSGTVKVALGNWGANSDQADGVVKNVCADNTYGGCGP